MKKLSVIAALAAFGLAGTLGYAAVPALAGSPVYAQEDCADGETWNADTGQCEKTQ